MQLVAYGAQDIYLTGNPQITFFKVVYRRHTNFSMECIEQTLAGTSTLSTSSTTNGTVTISRNGDLLSNIFVSSSTTSIENGDQIVSVAELEIGGQKIDKHTAEWNQIWAELTTSESKAAGYKAMTGALNSSLSSTGTSGVEMVQIPLNFWFCRNPGLALPLIALQYHEVKVKFTFGSGSGAEAKVKVWADYIYLDTDERRRFAQVSHEYLIEQLQYQDEPNTTKHKLNFNHPVKELIWTSPAVNAYVNAKLTLNGHDRFAEQEEEFFQLRQPYQYHTSVPGYNIPMTDRPQMLSQHLAAGAADLDSYITHNATTDKITAGVVDIATAAGTNPVVGDVIKVIEKSPIMLATPLYVAESSANGDAIADAEAANESKVTITATLTNTPAIGDILLIDTFDDSATQAAGQVGSRIVSVTNVAAESADFVVTPRITAVTDANDDVSFTITKIGHLTNVEVGTGVVTSVATAGTDFTLSNNDIVTKQDFKMHIVARAQDPQSRCSQLSKKINCYSFALKPEEHQPSGTCNFSRIDAAYLNLNTAPGAAFTIYAVNYNVLRIMSGMGGLAYSN